MILPRNPIITCFFLLSSFFAVVHAEHVSKYEYVVDRPTQRVFDHMTRNPASLHTNDSDCHLLNL